MKLCAYAQAPPCPCLATVGDYCTAHASTATKVGNKQNPVMCVRCGKEIKSGHFQKHTREGMVHAGYTCEPKPTA